MKKLLSLYNITDYERIASECNPRPTVARRRHDLPQGKTTTPLICISTDDGYIGHLTIFTYCFFEENMRDIHFAGRRKTCEMGIWKYGIEANVISGV